MKKFSVFLILFLFALTAFAQHRPRGRHNPAPRGPHHRPMPRPIPIPRPHIGMKCEVLLIDDWHRIYRNYVGRTEIISGKCRGALRQCQRDLRFNRSRGARCVQARGRW